MTQLANGCNNAKLLSKQRVPWCILTECQSSAALLSPLRRATSSPAHCHELDVPNMRGRKPPLSRLLESHRLAQAFC